MPRPPKYSRLRAALARARQFFAALARCLHATNLRCAAATDLTDQVLRHQVCSYMTPCCFHGYGLHAKIKQCFVCCRCRQPFDRLGEIDAHCYLEFLERFGKEMLPPREERWRCYGCMEEFAHWENYARHFRIALIKIDPEEDPRYLNLAHYGNLKSKDEPAASERKRHVCH